MIFSRIIPGEKIALIHTITDPLTGQSIYPDLLLSHPFAETAITSHELYEEVKAAISQYGTSRIYCITMDPDNTEHSLAVNHYLESVRAYWHAHAPVPFPSANDLAYIEQIADSLCLSHAMRQALTKLLTYYLETGASLEDLWEPFTQEYALPVLNKNQGKELYERIRNIILG